MNKHSTKTIRASKKKEEGSPLSMLTCYDYATAQILNESPLDMILVGDSLGNVILGLETTVSVTLEMMSIFSQAVRRGAPNKFMVVDLPFGETLDFSLCMKNCKKLFQESGADALKIEGATSSHLKIIQNLTANGIPVMGHIGLTPQYVHQLGGYYQHGKDHEQQQKLLHEARALQDHGAFALVLECVQESAAAEITQSLEIPTIGIGSGKSTDGQVLVVNDLLGLNYEKPPSFCTPRGNLYREKEKIILEYLREHHEL